jgi:hypothetical protein
MLGMAMSVTLVRVLMPDLYQDEPIKLIYVAAVPRDQAVEAVLREIPPTWIAELLPLELTAAQIAQLKIQPREVCELSSAL